MKRLSVPPLPLPLLALLALIALILVMGLLAYGDSEGRRARHVLVEQEALRLARMIASGQQSIAEAAERNCPGSWGTSVGALPGGWGATGRVGGGKKAA
jgi:hypothetical protein